MHHFFRCRRSLRVVILVGLAPLAASACHRNPARVPTADEQQADKYLFDRGTDSLARKRWLEAREYFRRLFDTYPQSPYRQDAKLGIGDSYLGEGRTDSEILAVAEFREFLRFFPLNAKADHAQYKLALAQSRQMLSARRDQTATRETLAEIDVFLRNYPGSALLPDVLKLQRETKDRLSDSEFMVGLQYYRSRWYPGAIPRFQAILKDDPAYTGRHEVYFYLAESLYLVDKKTDALPYYEKLVAEFAVSEHLENAKVRIAELKR